MVDLKSNPTVLEWTIILFLQLVLALLMIRFKQHRRSAASLRSNTTSEGERDVLLGLIHSREGLRDRIALAQAREMVKDLYMQGEELRKEMIDTLADIKTKRLRAAKEDYERILRDRDYLTDTDENLQMKRQMVLNLNAMGYSCKITDSWEVLYKHQITVTERLIGDTQNDARGQ